MNEMVTRVHTIDYFSTAMYVGPTYVIIISVNKLRIQFNSFESKVFYSSSIVSKE